MQRAEIGTEREKMITVCIMGVYDMLDFILNTQLAHLSIYNQSYLKTHCFILVFIRLKKTIWFKLLPLTIICLFESVLRGSLLQSYPCFHLSLIEVIICLQMIYNVMFFFTV